MGPLLPPTHFGIEFDANSAISTSFLHHFWMSFFHFFGILRVLIIMLIASLLRNGQFGYHFAIYFGGLGHPRTGSILASKMDPNMVSVLGPLLIGVLLTRAPLLEVLEDSFRLSFLHKFGCHFFTFLVS